jgi:hypothetical protein
MSSVQEIKQKHIGEKVLKYETFLNDHLKPDLKAVLEERDGVYTETANFWRSGTQSRLSNLQNLILLSR